MVDDIQAVRLMQGRGKFGQKAICRDAYVAAHPFSDFLPEALFNFPAEIEDSALIQTEGVCEVDHRLIN